MTSTTPFILAPTGFPAFLRTHGLPLLDKLRVTAVSGDPLTTALDGAYRAHPDAQIEWHSAFRGMALTTSSFTSDNIIAAVDACLKNCVVSPSRRQTTIPLGLRVCIGGYILQCTTSGETDLFEPAVHLTAPGQTYHDGSAVFTWHGIKVPAQWNDFFIHDLGSDLTTFVIPDSHNATVGSMFAALSNAVPTADWLDSASVHPGYSRYGLLRQLGIANITPTINSQLSMTYQHGVDPSGVITLEQHIANNAEVWSGHNGFKAIATILTQSSDATAAQTHADTIKLGVKGLWDEDSGRFHTVLGQDLTTQQIGDAGFVNDLRFHYWPATYGMWTDYDEVSKYQDGVLAYTLTSAPRVMYDPIADDPLTVWYFGAHNTQQYPVFGDVLVSRVKARDDTQVDVTDIALAMEATGGAGGTSSYYNNQITIINNALTHEISERVALDTRVEDEINASNQVFNALWLQEQHDRDAAVAGVTEALDSEIEARQNLAGDVSTLQTTVSDLQSADDGNYANVQTEIGELTTTTEALTARIDTVASLTTDKKVYVQATPPPEPPPPTDRAVWVNTNDENNFYIWDATTGTWVPDADNTVLGSLGLSFSGLSNEVVARTTADSAIADEITSLTAAVGDNAAAITAESQARVEDEASYASQFDTISAKAGKTRIYVQDSEPAGPTEAPFDALWIDTADNNKLLVWTTTDGPDPHWVDRSDQQINSATAAAITDVATASADADSALGIRIDGVIATADGNTAAINDEITTRADADTALGGRIDTLTATVGDNTAAISTEETARADADSALSGRVDIVSASVDGATAEGRVQFIASATPGGGADAEYSIQVRTTTGSGWVDTGFKMRAMSDGSSEIVFLSGNSKVSNGSNDYYPFAITSNGLEALAKLNGSLIISKSITAASGAIGDLAVDSLQINDNACTVPVGDQSFSPLTSAGTVVNTATITWYGPAQTNKIFVMWSGMVNPTGNSSLASAINIYCNGVLRGNFGLKGGNVGYYVANTFAFMDLEGTTDPNALHSLTYTAVNPNAQTVYGSLYTMLCRK